MCCVIIYVNLRRKLRNFKNDGKNDKRKFYIFDDDSFE